MIWGLEAQSHSQCGFAHGRGYYNMASGEGRPPVRLLVVDTAVLYA